MKASRTLLTLACLAVPLMAQQQEPKQEPTEIQVQHGEIRLSAATPEDGLQKMVGKAIALHRAGGGVLGVSSSPLPDVLKAQLGLKNGLVIDHVVEDSAASRAGIKAQDILLRMNDQLLFLPMQLRSLAEYYGSGNKVLLTYLRAGKEAKTECVLDEVRSDNSVMISGTATAVSDIDLKELLPNLPGKAIDLSQAMTTIVVPDGKSLMIESKDGVRTLTIKDAQGKQVFQGPIETEEQRKSVPEEYQKFLKMADLPFGK